MPIPSNETIAASSSAFKQFAEISQSDLSKMILSGNSKSSALDLLPTSFVKQALPVLLPSIHRIVNQSLTTNTMPENLKQKSQKLDPENVCHPLFMSNTLRERT